MAFKLVYVAAALIGGIIETAAVPPSIVLDGARDAEFVYDNSGNLIGSWAATAGTDSFGNAYPAGLNVTVGSISGSTFNGPNLLINAAGAFFYSGTPAAGNLVASIAATGGNDPFGNAYHAVVAAGNQAGAYTRIGTTGIIHMQNSAGQDVLQLDPTRSAILIYAGTPALGNLTASFANAPGTDSLGNHFLGGLSQYDPQGSNNFFNAFNGQLQIGKIVAHVPDTAHASNVFAGEYIGPTDSVNTISPTYFQAQGQPGASLSSGLGPVEQHYGTSTTPLLDVIVGARVSGTINGLGAIVADTWQTPAYGTNWAASTTFNGLTGCGSLQLRRTAHDNVYMTGAFKAGAVAPVDPVFILPAGLIPAGGTWFLPALRNNAGTVTACFVRVSNNGHVDLLNAVGSAPIAAGNEWLVTGSFPLGNIA